MTRPRLLLADRIKSETDSFLAPLLPALRTAFDVRFLTAGPGEQLAAAIGWADIVWLEWCWDHAVWATGSGLLQGRPTIIRLHSIEALQTDFPAKVNWSAVTCLMLVADDTRNVLLARFPHLQQAVRMQTIPNGIDLARFAPRAGPHMSPGPAQRFNVAWVGHLEPKKNPMLLPQIAHRLRQVDGRYSIGVAGAFTDIRTSRYLEGMITRLDLGDAIRFHGPVTNMPDWYADHGVLLSTSMYESFGMNIGEAMAVGCFPVVHAFPGAEQLWPEECLFATIDEAVALIRSARTGLYRDWVAERYALQQQERAVLLLLQEVVAQPAL